MFIDTAGLASADHIVLLHAANFSSRMWRPVTERLDEFQLCLPDLPGHGRSIDEDFVSIEQAADELAHQLRQHASDGRFHIVGLSLGAYVGLMLLMRHPGLASSAVLSGFHIGDMPNPRMMIAIGDLLSLVATTAWFQRKSAASMGVPPDLLSSEGAMRAQTTGRNIRRVNRAAVRFDVRGELDTILTPVLALAGSKEHPTILRSLEFMQRHVASCDARTVTGGGHAWPVKRPDLFADAVRAWVHGADLPDELQQVSPPAHVQT